MVVTVGWYLAFRRKVAVQRSTFLVLLATGLIGSLALGIFIKHTGGFYSFIEEDPPHHTVAAFWNFFYSLVRSIAWWCPFYLTLLVVKLRSSRLNPGEWFLFLQGAATVAAFSVFIDNGQVEFGSRYWLPGWSLWAPLAGAGAVKWLKNYRGKLSYLAICLALVVLAPIYSMFQATRTLAPWAHVWLTESQPAGSLIFVRSSPGDDPTGLMQNLPHQDTRFLLFLDPDLTRALRKVWSDRPAFVVDFRDGRYQVTPFEAAEVDSSFSLMNAANNTARILGQREKAIELWRRIPEGDPFFGLARLNVAVALFVLRRGTEAELELTTAERAGAPPQATSEVRRRFQSR
jgi:hypothetical protein